MNKKTIKDLFLKNKKVLLRCDFNVPIKDNKIIDEVRIIESLPTIKKLIKEKCKIIICSHLGKPKNAEDKFSLNIVAKKLSEILNKEVIFYKNKDVVNENIKKIVKNMNTGDILLLENTRFRKEETKNDDEFSKELSSLGDIYINDAFGSCHRSHCSIVGVPKFIKESAIGYLVEKELNFLENTINNCKRPFTVILGGAKVSDKINIINNLLNKADIIIIGGGMAYTFSKALGYNVGNSILEEDKIDYAKEIIKKAKDKGIKLILPLDYIVVDKLKEDAEYKNINIKDIKDKEIGVDIGEKTRLLFRDFIKKSNTLIWNGPMGIFEMKNFAKGTISVAEDVSKLNGTTIVCGGDSIAAINTLGFKNKIKHISTGGGALLKYLEGKELPGIFAIENKK